jgi:hypothetical protein
MKSKTSIRKIPDLLLYGDPEVTSQVLEAFENDPYAGQRCTRSNPVTGSGFMGREDPLKPQLEAAYRALRARKHLAAVGPTDLPPLPTSDGERERMKVGGVTHILAWFARSWEGLRYELTAHPDFETYARGVMASDHAPSWIRNDPELLRRFPPRPLPGLGSGLYWPSKQEPKKSRPTLLRTFKAA